MDAMLLKFVPKYRSSIIVIIYCRVVSDSGHSEPDSTDKVTIDRTVASDVANVTNLSLTLRLVPQVRCRRVCRAVADLKAVFGR